MKLNGDQMRHNTSEELINYPMASLHSIQKIQFQKNLPSRIIKSALISCYIDGGVIPVIPTSHIMCYITERCTSRHTTDLFECESEQTNTAAIQVAAWKYYGQPVVDNTGTYPRRMWTMIQL